MEEENIFDEHEPALGTRQLQSNEVQIHMTYSLSNGREESIEDSRCHEAVESRGSGTPDGSSKSKYHEVEEYWKTSKICRENDGCNPAWC